VVQIPLVEFGENLFPPFPLFILLVQKPPKLGIPVSAESAIRVVLFPEKRKGGGIF